MNTVLTLWAIPAGAILAAILLLARQTRDAMPKGALEPARGLKRKLVAVARPAGMEQPQTRDLPTAPPRRSAGASDKKPGFDPLSRENLEQICSRFGVRTISILPLQADENVEILLEFEPEAKRDYAVVSPLRQELFAILGRPVDLVCRNSAQQAARQGMFERALVLYAA